MSAPAPEKEVSQSERRRGQRVFLALAVEVHWPGASERAETGVVSAFGATLRMKTTPAEGSEVELRLPNGASARARVAGVRPQAADGSSHVAVELFKPSETLWGINLPPAPVYSFRVAATPEQAAELAELVETLNTRPIPGELRLELSSPRPLPPDLWNRLQQLLDAAKLNFEKNV